MNEEAHARVKGESEKSLSLWKVKVNVQSVNDFWNLQAFQSSNNSERMNKKWKWILKESFLLNEIEKVKVSIEVGF